MRNFDITGMSCAACSARIEKTISSLDNVSSCSVNLLTNSMSVEGEISTQEIVSAVESIGYGAKEKGKPTYKTQKDNKKNSIAIRLVVSAVLVAVLMVFSMGGMIFKDFRLPEFFESNPLLQALVQMFLALLVMIVNKNFFTNGFKGALHLAPNMDTLVALGSLASFLYSTAVVVKMTMLYSQGQIYGAAHLLHSLYFESAAMILCLITVGKLLESRSKGKTTNAIKSLMDLSPKTAMVLKDGKETTVSVDELKVGDVFIVKAGGSFAADALVLEGECSVDESAITGESIPIYKGVGDSVTCATTNLSGYVKCKAERVSEDTTLSKIIKMVENASGSKAPIAKIADKVSGIFVPIVIAIAVLTFVVWLIASNDFARALNHAVSVLVISCPCALGLATPVAIMVGNGVAAKNNILFKTAEALEIAGKVKTVLLDKTGTITEGKPSVTDIVCAQNVNEQELLKYAYAVEKKSEHPLSMAVVAYAEQNNVPLYDAQNVKTVAGKGIEGELSGDKILAGNSELIKDIPVGLSEKAKMLSQEGKTPLYFSKNCTVLGIIAVADTVKSDSIDAVKALSKMGIKIVMLTGDNELCANAIGKGVGVDEIYAGVLPDGKQKYVEKFKQNGRVMMVGDGINDTVALTAADVGVAIGAGVDIAIESADVVLSKSRLSDVVTLVKLSRKTLKNIKENLFWAFVYNLVGIPLAAGVFTSLLGWELTPMFGAAAMSLSSFCVVTNALRLNFFKANYTKKEKKKMTKTIIIEGMMCPHCSGRVKDELLKLAGVDNAEVSHQSKTAVLNVSQNIEDEILKATVENCGYKVIEIK